MSSWLYPISSSSGNYFEDKRGKRVPASYESFRDKVVPGLIKDDEWRVRNNFDKVRPGDELFIYTGDDDHGIIAYAKITGTIPKTRSITFRFDRAKTSRLLFSDPVPADHVPPLIPPPRASLVNLERGIRQIRKLLPWSAAYRAQSSAVLSDLNLRPVTVTTAKIKGGVRPRWLLHDSVLGPVRTYLKAEDFRIGTRSFGRLRIDLVGKRGRNLVIVEAKVIERGEGRQQAREGLGQLLEYSWLFGQEKGVRFYAHILWLAFSSQPESRVQEFLANQNVLVSWPAKRGLILTDSRRLARA